MPDRNRLTMPASAMPVRGLHARCGAALACLFATVSANAQAPAGGQAPPDAASPTPVAAANPADATQPADIVVTGSRITRRDLVAESPIVTLGQQTIERSSGVTIETTLNRLPQFTPSFGAASATPPGRGGQANLNLRGLGTNRSLVLIDGRRVQPSNGDSTVDVNIIPSTMIENVETITGGASATYGSDAIAGVVNFKLRHDYKGILVNAQTGVSSRGDGGTRQIGLLAGAHFGADRGRVVAGFEYSARDRVTRRDRPFYVVTTPLAYIPSGSANLSANPPSQAAVNAVFGAYGAAAGAISRTTPFGINTDGTLFTAAPATSPVFNYKGPINSDILIYNNSVVSNGLTYDIQLPLTRYSGIGRLEYDVTPAITAYADLLFTHYDAQIQVRPSAYGLQGSSLNVPVTNPFIPADLRTLLASRANPTATFPLNYLVLQNGPQLTDEAWTSYQATVGLKGKLGIRDWTWDVYAEDGRTRNREVRPNWVSLSAGQALVSAPGGGSALCAGGFNVFGIQPVSADCIAYITRRVTSRSTFKQRMVEGSVQGGLADLPAGDLRFALGADYRWTRYDYAPDPLLASGDIVGGAAGGAAGGRQHVTEGYAELLVPVLHDLPLVRKLEVDLGYRYSDYNLSGGVSTYKADLNWAVAKAIRVRGGYSRAVRAPSLADLYAAPTVVASTVGAPVANGQSVYAGDPCDVRSAYRTTAASSAQVRALCLAQGIPAAAIDTFTFSSTSINGTTRGNTALSPEKADTYSAGLVLQSPFTTPLLSRLSASIDYFHIAIAKAVGQLPLATALSQCFNADGSNPSYANTNVNCSYIARNAQGLIVSATVPTLNLGSYKTSGIDATVDWRVDLAAVGLPNAGAVELGFVGTYLRRFDVQSLPNTPVLAYAGTTSGAVSGGILPRFRSTTTLTYDLSRASLSAEWQHISPLRDSSRVTNAASTIAGVPAYNYFNLLLRVRANARFEGRFGVNNIGDKGPPQIGTTPGNTDANAYDVLGRRYFVGFNVKY